MLVALFSERESYAVYFLQQQDMSRLDAVTYISHGVGKGEAAAQPPEVKGTEEIKQEEGKKKPESALKQFTDQSEREGAGRPGRSADRPRAGGRPDRPDPLPPLEEQPALRRRSRRRQDRDRRGSGAQDHRGRRARGAEAGGHLFARHGRFARRHPLSRRFRGAAEGGRQRAREAPPRDPVHRRDPHRDRRRRHLGRRDGRVEPVEARALLGDDPLHRLDHLQGIPQPFREGPGAAPALPEDRHQRADGRGHDQDPRRPPLGVRGASRRQIYARRDQGGGRAVGALHQRPQAARQGDRRDRRGRRDADAGRPLKAQEDDHHEGDRGGDLDHRPDPGEERVERRQEGARASRQGPEAGRLRPGRSDRPARLGDQARPRRPSRSRQADRLLSVLRPDRRRQDRGRAPARLDHGHPAPALRHVANIWSGTASRG